MCDLKLNDPNKSTPWYLTSATPKDNGVNFYCFGHAGSYAGEYLRLFKGASNINIRPIQLPGRGTRIKEKPIHKMENLIDQLIKTIDVESPYILFGHSLGGLIAYEMAQALYECNKPQPAKLIISSVTAPSIPRTNKAIYKMPDEYLLNYVESRWGKLPENVKQHANILKSSLATLRADLEIYETYTYKSKPPLSCSIYTLKGEQENMPMNTWKIFTNAEFNQYSIPGGHFYFREHGEQFHQVISQII